MEAKKKKIIAHFLIIAFFIVAIIGLVLTQTQIAYADDNTSGLPIEGDLKFSLYTNLDGIQEYKVSAYNRNLVKAIIPEEYNGIPVSEVADNAFANCKNLTYALVPLSIKRVGNNAFSFCTNLKSIDGMTNVKTFGNFVFNNCSSLNNLILPAKVEKLGTNVIKNIPNQIYSRKTANEMQSLNETWADEISYKNVIFNNAIVCEDIEINGQEGYLVKSYQSINVDEDVVLYSYADIDNVVKPILEINSFAFAGCTFGSLTIKNAKPEDNHLINLKCNAFNSFEADFLSIEVGITLKDEGVSEDHLGDEIGYSTDIFSNTYIPEITLPTNSEFDRFTRSMFSYSQLSTLKFTDTNLPNNHIASNVTKIYNSAFEGVETLQEIYIPSTINIMGENVFDYFGSERYDKYYINIDFPVAPEGWSSSWLGNINNNVEVKYTKADNVFEVMLNKENGNGGDDSVIVEYDKPMPSAIAPTKNNYIFMGYFTGRNGTGVKYYNANMTSAQNWNTQSNGTLYAYWKGVESVIKFDKMGGINGQNEITAEYGKPMPTAVAPSKTNYVFQGYYTDKNGKGTKYYDANMNSVNDWDKAINTTLYAHWLGTPSIIKFDQQGGVGGSADAVAIFGDPMPDSNNYGKLIAPTRQNYIFQGYFDQKNGQGIKYYDENMQSCINWNKSTETTLYAAWKGVNCLIYFNKDGGTGGKDFITVEYGAKLPQLSKNDAPTKKLFVFKGYQYNNTNYYTDNMECNKYWYNTEPTSMQAIWEGEAFTINLNGSNNDLSITVNYYGRLPQNLAIPEKVGYTFDGFYLEGYNKKIYNADMSSAIEVWDIDHAEPLYALWKANTYKIILADNQNQDISAIYNDVMPHILNLKQKPGYNLIGYFSEPNGGGKQYYKFTYKVWKNQIFVDEQRILSLCDFAYDITLYPKYEAIEYKITVWMSDDTNTLMESREFYLNYGNSRIFTVPTYDGYTYVETKRGWRTDAGEVKDYFTNSTSVTIEVFNPYMTLLTYDVIYQKNECVAEGSLITLADGSQVPVEQLTGKEQLLVWNLKTGAFDTAPILFIDHDKKMNYEVINLEFSDGTTVKVISEHAFWDFDLNQYVFLRKDAAKYIGHWFNKQIIDDNGNMTWIKVRLTDVEVRNEYTSAWSPVTYGHLCYYVNGMLSMPGATEGLINIFDVDSDTMKFNEISYQEDIEKYGIFTYEEFAELYPVPREIFDAFNAEYLKVSLGKGLITQKQLERLIKIYSKFFM